MSSVRTGGSLPVLSLAARLASSHSCLCRVLVFMLGAAGAPRRRHRPAGAPVEQLGPQGAAGRCRCAPHAGLQERRQQAPDCGVWGAAVADPGEQLVRLQRGDGLVCVYELAGWQQVEFCVVLLAAQLC